MSLSLDMSPYNYMVQSVKCDVIDKPEVAYIRVGNAEREGPSYYYYYIIRTFGTTDKMDRRTHRHTENKHKCIHYR